jgi:hypothetical protein
MRYFAERRGACVVTVPVPVPFTDPGGGKALAA